ncbi:MAG: hypothetical protein IJZ87_01945 [Bacteroidales bacterium]|nr:hypothetical protein [Bacteroidales bacterium]
MKNNLSQRQGNEGDCYGYVYMNIQYCCMFCAYCVGFGVARSDLEGNARALMRGTGIEVSRFFYV